MGDSGAARQLQRSEWCWLYPQARPPHTQPRAPPPPFRPRRARCPSTSTAWLTDCSVLRRRPRPRPRAPHRSPPLRGTRRAGAEPHAEAVTHPDAHPAARGTPGARDPAARAPLPRPRRPRLAVPVPGTVNRSAGTGRRRPGRDPGPRRSRPVAVDHCPRDAVGRRRVPDRHRWPRNGVGQAPLRQHVDGGHVNAPGRRTVALAGPGHRPRCTVPRRRCRGPADAPRLSAGSLPAACSGAPRSGT